MKKFLELFIVLVLTGISTVSYADGTSGQIAPSKPALPCAGDAFKICLTQAEQGDAASQFAIGKLYQNGSSEAKQDFKEAEKWYRRAAEQGEPRAQNNLGMMYNTGMGVTKDEKEAAKWYLKSAEQNHATAEFNIAQMYENGEGVPRDYHEAIKWYERCAAQGGSTKSDIDHGVTTPHSETLKKLIALADTAKKEGKEIIVADHNTSPEALQQDNARMRGSIQTMPSPQTADTSEIIEHKLPYVFKTRYKISGLDATEDRKIIYAVGEIPVEGDPSDEPARAANDTKAKPPAKHLTDTDREGHLLVFDASDPAKPVLISDIITGHENPEFTCISGNKLFLRSSVGFYPGHSENLVTYDVSNPAKPVFQSALPGEPRYYSPDGNMAILYQYGRHRLFDMSDATHPKEIADGDAKINDIFTQMNAKKIEWCSHSEAYNPGPDHRGRYDKMGNKALYEDWNGFEFQDVSDPDHPQTEDMIPVANGNRIFHYRQLPGHENFVFTTSFVAGGDTIVFLSSQNSGLCAAHNDSSADMICKNGNLTLLDNDLNYLYQRRLDGLSGVEKKKEIKLQRQWLKEKRDVCLKQTSDEDKASCMKQAYLDRLQELSSR